MSTSADNQVSTQGSFLKISRCQLDASLRFGLASLLVYSTVAFGERWMYQQVGLVGAYGIWTLLFILLGGQALQPLVVRATAKRTFWLWFSLAFLGYAASWMAAYFTIRGPVGEWMGSVLGSAALGMVLAAVFRAWNRYFMISVQLFVAHSAGYFLGEWFHHSVQGRIGMLLSGVCYGLGFGLGLARALFWAQTADAASTRPTLD